MTEETEQRCSFCNSTKQNGERILIESTSNPDAVICSECARGFKKQLEREGFRPEREMRE